MSVLNTALGLAQHGIPVFPCRYGAKTPATKHGFKDASTDQDQVRQWFDNGRKFNLAMPTGAVSGQIVIDNDRYKPGAESSLAELEAKLGKLPETRTIRTRAGGSQHYFKAPVGVKIPCSSGELATGIDIRGDGGYVVQPPSWVDEDQSGPAGHYSVENDAELAELPQNWIDALIGNRQPDNALNSDLTAGVKPGFVLPERIPQGQTNKTLWAYLGHLLGRNVPADVAEQAVRLANDARCETPLDEEELHKVLRHVIGQGDSTGWPDPLPVEFKLPAVKPWTRDMMPVVMGDYVEDCAERMSCEPDFIAASLVVAASAALGSRVRIAPKAKDVGWFVVANLWGLIVGSSGLMKSPAINAGVKPLEVLEDELTDTNQRKRQEYELAKARHKQAEAEFQRRAKVDASLTADDVPVAPDEPRDERLVVNDATVEKLGEILLGSPFGVLLLHDELMGWVDRMGAQGREGDRTFALTGWNGDQGYKWDRVIRGSVHVPSVTLSVFGGTQPGKLNAHVRAATRSGGGADGFLQRFQIAVYPDTPRRFKIVDRPPDLGIQQQVIEAFRGLWKIDPTVIGARSDLEGKKHWLHFDSEAQELFNTWWEQFENKVRSGDKHPALISHHSKFRSLVPSLALIFHLIEGNTGPVGRSSLWMALQWASYLASHARRIYAGAVASGELAAEGLARHIKKGDLGTEFGLRDIYRRGWAGMTEKDDALAAVEVLLDQAWLREIPSERGRRGARYKVNPKLGVSNVSSPNGQSGPR